MEMLGLPLATSPEANVVRTAWKRLCLKVHPDKCTEARAEEAFKELDSAYKKVVP